jgi:hypothetical protein
VRKLKRSKIPTSRFDVDLCNDHDAGAAEANAKQKRSKGKCAQKKKASPFDEAR